MVRPLLLAIATPLMLSAPFSLMPTAIAEEPTTEEPTPSEASETIAAHNASPVSVERLHFATSDWTIHIEPRGYLTSPSGKIKMPGSGTKVRIENLNLDEPEMSPAAMVKFQKDDWTFSISGFQYEHGTSTNADYAFTLGTVGFAPNDPMNVDFEIGIYDLNANYNLYDFDFQQMSEHPENAIDAQLRIDATAGLRVTDLDFTVASSTARAHQSSTFIEAVLGGHAELRVAHDFSMDLELNGGFGPDSTSLDIAVAFRYAPRTNVGVEIGWRQVAYSLKDGDFEYNGRMAGLFTGIVLRF